MMHLCDIIVLNTWSFIAAADTAHARMDIHLRQIKDFNRMSFFLCAFDKGICQHIGRTMGVRTSF